MDESQKQGTKNTKIIAYLVRYPLAIGQMADRRGAALAAGVVNEP